MRVVTFILGLQAAAAAFAVGGTSYAGPAGIEAKFDYCQTCHGPSAQGFRGYYTMPRLAGQQPQYIVNQLHAFMAGRRHMPIMQRVVTGLTPDMIAPLAQRLSRLNPPPYVGGGLGSPSVGRSIFESGVPEANIPACVVCHAPSATGHNQIPRLAGQLPWYLAKTLANWERERHTETSAIMAPIARNLSPAQVSAIAAYVSTLR